MPHRSISSHYRSLANTLGCAAAVLIATSSPVWAAADNSVQHYEIPPASLGTALNQLGQQAHLLLSFSNDLIAGQNSPGLSGDYTVDGALQVLLAGSQLIAVRQPDGRYTLQRAPASSALELQSISISGKAPGSTTEGTGLYTTYSSSSSTRLNLTPKETPQSLTVMTRQRLDDQRLTNLSDTLDATPGVIVLRDGLGAESDGYFSRGFEIQNFEIDGVPTVKRMDNYTQSMAMYDRVEVVRGATGLISGLGSPSATINLIRKRPTAEAQASVWAEAGNWDRYGTGFDVSGPLTETGNYAVVWSPTSRPSGPGSTATSRTRN